MSAELEGKQAATTFRAQQHLGIQTLGDLVALIEQSTGYDVAVIDADPDEHGLTIRDPLNEVVLIGVACTRHPMRQRSTLAHELGHVIFTDWNDGKDLSARSQEEIRADAFARHLLMPEAGLHDFMGGRATPTEKDLSAVVQYFRVSPSMAANTFHNIGYIDDTTKIHWMGVTTSQLATRYGWIDQYQVLQADSDQPRAPQQLLARAIAGYEEGVVNLQTIATLRGVPAEQVAAEFDAAGIISHDLPIPSLSATDLPSVNVDLSDLDQDTPEESVS